MQGWRNKSHAFPFDPFGWLTNPFSRLLHDTATKQKNALLMPDCHQHEHNSLEMRQGLFPKPQCTSQETPTWEGEGMTLYIIIIH